MAHTPPARVGGPPDVTDVTDATGASDVTDVVGIHRATGTATWHAPRPDLHVDTGPDGWEDLADTPAPHAPPQATPGEAGTAVVVAAAGWAAAEMPATEMEAAEAVEVDPDPVLTYAQIEVAGHRLAVAAEHVAQALPRPTQLARLPGGHGALEGAFKLRGQVVPLIDLRHWLVPAGATDTAPRAPQPQVMVLGSQGQVVGVGTDAIHGLLRLRASRVQRIDRGESAQNLFHSVLSVSDGADLLSVLDPLRLMNLAQAWALDTTTDATTTTTSPAGVAGRPGATAHANHTPSAGSSPALHTDTQALLRLGTTVLSVAAQAIREVVPQPPLQRVFGRGNHLLGMVHWRGIDMPVLDPAQVLALPLEAQPGSPHLLAVLEQAGRYVGIPVDGVQAVRSFATAQVQPPTDTGDSQAHLLTGTTRLADNTRVLLLDSHAVLRQFGLSPLPDTSAEATTAARTEPPAGSPTSAQQGPLRIGHETARHTPQNTQDNNPKRTPAQEGHIVFDMGDEWAAPLSVLQAIAPLPDNFQASPGHSPALVGTCEWRGKTLPVLDLRPASDRRPDCHLLVVTANGRAGGVLVNRVVALLAANEGVHTRVTLPGNESVHLITVGNAAHRQSHRVLDFAAHPFFSSGD